jgi:hypothetical protein
MMAVMTQRHARRCAKLCLLATVLMLATLAYAARPISAEFGVPGTCSQDGLMPIPSALVQNGVQKDRNFNGYVCAKFADGRLVGGPDDDVLV